MQIKRSSYRYSILKVLKDRYIQGEVARYFSRSNNFIGNEEKAKSSLQLYNNTQLSHPIISYYQTQHIFIIAPRV
jgi:hypothetical protein